MAGKKKTTNSDPRRKRKRYVLGNYSFSSKTDIKNKCREIKNITICGSEIKGDDFLFLLELFKWHHKFHIKTNGLDTISNIKVDLYNGRYGTEKIFFIRPNSACDWIDISFNEAIGRKTSEQVARAEFSAALRLLVRKQIMEFRNGRVGGHVDHTGDREFRHLVEDFIETENIVITDLEYEKMTDYPLEDRMFTNVNLQKKWKTFHKKHAKLQLISVSENMRKPKAKKIKVNDKI